MGADTWEGLKNRLQSGLSEPQLSTAQIHPCLHPCKAKSLHLGPKSNLMNWVKAELIKCRREKCC